MLVFLLITFINSQTLTHQQIRPSKFNYDLASERLDCQKNKEILNICKSCKATHAYLLDEQNWLIVGVYHQFGYEFSSILEKNINSLLNNCNNYINLDQFMLLSILIIFVLQQQEDKYFLKYFLLTFMSYNYLNHFILLKNIVNTTLSQIDVKYNSTSNNFYVLNFIYNGSTQVDSLLSFQNILIKNQNVIFEKRGKFNSLNNNQQISLTQIFNYDNSTFEELSIDFMPPQETFFKFVMENYSPFYQSQMKEYGENKTKLKALITKEIRTKQKIFKLNVQE